MGALVLSAILVLSGPAVVTAERRLGERVSSPSYDGIIMAASHGSEWTPSEQQVRELESALVPYANSELKKWKLRLPKRLSTYKRQYSGFLANGRRMIAITFFHESTDVVTSGKWLRVLMAVAGGGGDFLHALYNADSKLFQEFTINAPE